MSNLWSSNHPSRFWLCDPSPSEEVWQAAIDKALPVLGLPDRPANADALMEAVLGEGQFGPDRYRMSLAKRVYYEVKPLLPRSLTRLMRQKYSTPTQETFRLGWPVEDRYVRFLLDTLRNAMQEMGVTSLEYTHFWPEARRYAFVLTHDIEWAKGQAYVRQVADLVESHGFRSCFNFVPERYELDYDLMAELNERGFEVGVHGLKHDGKLFTSRATFDRRVGKINAYVKKFGAQGFAAPLTHRNPYWMQAFDVSWDRSFFDTDPYEPMVGGVMTIWPFFMGKFVELPYTMVQDYTLTSVRQEFTPDRWLEKLAFVERSGGMALLNTHPDYLLDDKVWNLFDQFLGTMEQRSDYWHALPRDVAQWWRARAEGSDTRIVKCAAVLENGTIELV
ncbi:MAG TPA: hypothetical protein PKD09_03620 [Aggregatilinea sp.]|uniref:hypothetical protein n=1 Tax=Aggregatilinea sp. TaxID=2806333 RepID=UPI002BC1581B|nr:hypothetical protein [Aggregatilinea sp.]HML20712.1 hypothetical protein [Aggregatilinea sp.]